MGERIPKCLDFFTLKGLEELQDFNIMIEGAVRSCKNYIKVADESDERADIKLSSKSTVISVLFSF